MRIPIVGTRQSSFSIISPARFLMEARARQVGFMSTQKRETPRQRMSCTERAGARDDSSPAHIGRFVCAVAGGGTAPLWLVFGLAIAWLATKFLQSDYLIGQLVQPVLKADRRGSPPPGVGRRAALGIQASPRSSLPPIPFPSGFAPLHLPLPQAPVGYRHRAERYDGKRDMYFLHAA